MSPHDRQPRFETGPAGFVAVNRTNILVALEGVLPPEVIAQIRAGLERIDAARQKEAPSNEPTSD